MAEKLSVVIALEGGAEIQKQLKDIGTVGQKVFLDISKAAEQVGGFKNLDPTWLTAKYKEMGVAGSEAFNKITTAVESARRIESLVGVVRNVEQGFARLSETASKISGVLAKIGNIGSTLAGIGLVKEVIEPVLKALNDAAAAIGRVDAAAIKLGKTIETFDKMRLSAESAGASVQGIAAAMDTLAAAVQKGKLAQVGKDIATLREAGSRGYGIGGTPEEARLQTAAQGVGPVAEAAKAGLKEFGVEVASTFQSLSELTAKLGDAAGFKAFLAEIDGMKDGVQRSQAVMDTFGNAFGVELVKHLNAGGHAMDYAKEQAGGLSQAQADAATKVEESNNRMAASWERFKATGDSSNLGKIWDDYSAQMDKATAETTKNLETLTAAFAKFLNTPFGSGRGDGGSAPAHASGGLIGGSGTGTSDSNLAWVSRGEHIMPAAAVSQPGVLSLLESLRASGGNLRGLGGFATGGVVSMPALAGAGGGIGHLGTVDLRTDHGSVTVMASQSAVDQLGRLAVTKRMTSTGRKPGFIG